MVDVVICFDTTASMYPALAQLRTKIKFLVNKLHTNVDDLRLAIIGHGDYCTADKYIVQHIGFTSDQGTVCNFVDDLQRTGGQWDEGEAYEQALWVMNSLAWRPTAKKIVILAGDDIPHGPFFPANRNQTDWRFELQRLVSLGVRICAVHCLGRRRATFFYRELASVSGGHYLPLDQFAYVTDLIIAIVFREESKAAVEEYEAELKSQHQLNSNLQRVVNQLLDRQEPQESSEATAATAATAARFQVLQVTAGQSIRSFVESFGIVFKAGRGFYEFTKRETISPKKEIILQNPQTGEFFTGVQARQMLGIPQDTTIKMSPNSAWEFRAFIQSTSYNRKLIGGTRFLYEVQDDI